MKITKAEQSGILSAAERNRALIMIDLKERLASFKRSKRPRERIPEKIRAAMVAALDQGIAPDRLRIECALSERQIGNLIARQARQRRHPSQADVHGARVFDVVDDSASHHAPGGIPPTQSLELRLGSWEVSVRLAAPQGREE